MHTDGKGEYHIPFGVHLPTCRNCVVYDSNTVSTVEDSELMSSELKPPSHSHHPSPSPCSEAGHSTVIKWLNECCDDSQGWLRTLLCRVPLPTHTQDHLHPNGERLNHRSACSHSHYRRCQELECLPRYPNEVLPLSLYLGEQCHAYNASLNYDLKIHAHVSVGTELHTAFPGSTPELHIDVEDAPDSNLLDHFEDIFQFIGHYYMRTCTLCLHS